MGRQVDRGPDPGRALRPHRLSLPLRDPDRAQRNRLARDQLVADDAVRTTRRLGIRVIEVNGAHDADAMAAVVADHFAPYLPPADLER